MHFHNYSYFPRHLNNALQSLQRDDSIHITRADKSKVIVVMDKDDYTEKMEELLFDVNTYEELNSDPCDRVNSQYHKCIREIFGSNKEMISKFQSCNSKLPYLYGVLSGNLGLNSKHICLYCFTNQLTMTHNTKDSKEKSYFNLVRSGDLHVRFSLAPCRE